MLIVAAPKTASTSLLHTLRDRHAIEVAQRRFPDLPLPEEFSRVGGWHACIREFPAPVLAEMAGAPMLYKQHVPPTPGNRAQLGSHPIVVLLRPPLEIIDAYWRADRAAIHTPRPGFEGVRRHDQWVERAHQVGIVEEVTAFVDGWSAPDPARLTIWFAELIGDPDAVVARIETHLGMRSRGRPVTLAESRYSRNQARNALRRARAVLSRVEARRHRT